MHDSSYMIVEAFEKAHARQLKNGVPLKVLDVGSYDVNGTYKPIEGDFNTPPFDVLVTLFEPEFIVAYVYLLAFLMLAGTALAAYTYLESDSIVVNLHLARAALTMSIAWHTFIAAAFATEGDVNAIPVRIVFITCGVVALGLLLADDLWPHPGPGDPVLGREPGG